MIHRIAVQACLAVASFAWAAAAYSVEQPPRPPTPIQSPAKPDKALYDTEDPTIIKKSRSNICHDRTSGAFALTTSFKAYRTMKDCLESGGRLPR